MGKKEILIVEDDPSIRTTLKGILEEEGFNVTTAEDGFKALRELKARPFSLVLIDLMMPGMCGVETLREIKKIRPTTAIAMTGHVASEDLPREAKAQGAKAIIYKPFRIPELLRLIETIIGEKNLRLLVVDDEDSACKTLSGILEDSGYEVDTAPDGQEAIEKAKESNYHLIFMDAKMPGINGFQAMKEIKTFKPEVPIVMLTGHKIENFMERSKACGARAIMFKPFDMKDVLKLAEEVIVEGRCPEDLNNP